MAIKESWEVLFLKFFKTSIDGSIGFGIKNVLFESVTSNALGEVVIKLLSQN